MLDNEQIEEIKKTLYKKFRVDDTTADTGCYSNGVWFSVQSVLETIKNQLGE